MGCLFSHFNRRKPLEEEDEEPKEYSWNVRPTLNISDYIIEDKDRESIMRMPGTVNGQQLVIQKCVNCCIYIFDHTATITVDDCIDCRMFFGPIKTSVFFRDCKNIQVVVACQQFRTRDCSKMDVFLHCATQPTIEATNRIKFGCFQFHYGELEQQFKAAEKSVFNNNWSQVHDFTPSPGETNFSLMSVETTASDHIPLPIGDSSSEIVLSYEPSISTVPLTLGSRRKASEESCLVVFFNDGCSHERAMSFFRDMKIKFPDTTLIQTKEADMMTDDALHVFGTSSYEQAVKQGAVIGLEFNGEGALGQCQQLVVKVTKGTTGLVFVSLSAAAALTQIDNFYHFIDMQMGV